MERTRYPITRLRQEREQRGLSQERLGLALGGLTPNAVSRWECGNREPGKVVRVRLEKLFGLPWSDLRSLADKD